MDKTFLHKISQIRSFINSDIWIKNNSSEFSSGNRLWISVLFHYSPPELTGNLLTGKELSFLNKNPHLSDYVLDKSEKSPQFNTQQTALLRSDARLQMIDWDVLVSKIDSFIVNIIENPDQSKYHFIKLLMHPDLSNNSFRTKNNVCFEKEFGE